MTLLTIWAPFFTTDTSKYISNWSDHAVPPNVMFRYIYLKCKIIIYLKPKEFLSQIIVFCLSFTIFISDVYLNIAVISIFLSLNFFLTSFYFSPIIISLTLHYIWILCIIGYLGSSAGLLPQTSFLF